MSEASFTLFQNTVIGIEIILVADGIVLDSDGGMHGVGLMNVRAVVDKYDGDFAISCDREKFQAVVMI